MGWPSRPPDGADVFVERHRPNHRFAAYNGSAPIEWSSGNPKGPTHRLSRRGNRAMNHALHIAAVTQLRHSHSPGRACYDRKLSEGHTPQRSDPGPEATASALCRHRRVHCRALPLAPTGVAAIGSRRQDFAAS